MYKIFFVSLFLFASVTVVFSNDNGNLLDYYDSEIMKINYTMMGGLTLNYQGQATSTDFGVSSYFKDVLMEFEDSGSFYESYRSKNKIGNTLMITGLGVMLMSFVPFLIPDMNSSNTQLRTNIALGLYSGGLASILVGSFYIPISLQDLTHSVNLFNRNKIKKY